ncbi:MAG: Fe-S-containing protein [Candidatus Eiseniibacteriota bacterium]
MLEALVIVLREGVEAALVVAIVLAYLRKTGRSSLAPYVYAGVGLALIGSAAGAWALQALQWNPETFEGVLLLVGAACVITLVLWMNRAAKGLKREIETQVESTTSRSAGTGLGLLVFCALMILREGVETVLFLTALSFNTDGLSQLIGAGLGLALAILFAVFLIRGSLQVDIGKFFRVTTVLLLVLAFQLIVGGLHELSESGVLPSSRTEMAIVGPIVRNDALIFQGAIVLAIALVGFGAPKRPAGAAAPGTPSTPSSPDAPGAAPAARLALADERRRRAVRIGALVTGLLVVGTLTAGFLLQPGPPPKAEATPVTAEAGGIVIPLASVNDGHIHFYDVTDPDAPGARLRFFAIRKPDGAIQACMDACEICGDQGYYEEAGAVTCRNCSAPIVLTTLGQAGGCNPIPVASRVEGDRLVVDPASIYAQRILQKGKR